MATAGEEYGKLGAQRYREEREQNDTLKIIKYCFELDSLTWGNNFQLYSTDEHLLQMANEANDAMEINGTPKLFNEFSGGDSKPFFDASIPTLYVNTRGEKYMDKLKLWHRPEDTPETVAPELVENGFLLFRQILGQMITPPETGS
jgi:Zn-dependent M28 family amino/carboxypeptidase